MHLFLKNNTKIERFFGWLVFDPIKHVKYGVFIFKVVSHFTLHLLGTNSRIGTCNNQESKKCEMVLWEKNLTIFLGVGATGGHTTI
jgi:hypothetical protein